MTRWFSLRIICGLSMFLLVSACGGGDDIAGGGLALDTVMVTAQVSTGRLESDVITDNSCSTGETGTLTTDYVDVNVKSTPYPGIIRVTSPVSLDSYTTEFRPLNSISPQLPSLSGSMIGTTINPGDNVPVPVAVAPESFKLSLIQDKNLLPCSATIYEYYAVITFSAVETFTGRRGTLISSLNVAFADRN